MNTAEYIIKKLEELGVNDFFGLPGDYNFNIIEAVNDNTNANWIGCTNELNAGYAADGYARIRGYGAIITTYGVGELSAINAIAGSFAESVPVVHIVGMPDTKQIDKKVLLHHNFQEVDYKIFHEMYKNITCASAFLTKENAKMEIDRVLKTLVIEKKPVYIAIPSDIAQRDISDKYVSYDWISEREVLKEAAERIAEKIKKSKRPVIIGDALVKRFDAEIEYKEFVSKSKIPTTNFLMGSNLIEADTENYIGTYFSKYRNPIAEKYVHDTDCAICVGMIYSDLNSFGQELPFKPTEQIAIFGNYTYINGEKYDNIKMADVLETVTKIIEQKKIEIDKPIIGYKYKNSENEELTSDYIYPRIQEFLKDNDIVICETGLAPYGAAQIKFPYNTDVQFQSLWCSIGWATPAAFGACIAKPQSRVVLITGDGAHQVSGMEIGNMLRYNTKPIIIVINNEGYSIERFLSDTPEADFNNIAHVNFSKLARAFEGDIWSTRVNTDEDFDKALKVTQIMNKLCYIEACTSEFDAPNLAEDMLGSNKKKKKNSAKTNKKKEKDNKKESPVKQEQDNTKKEEKTEILHRDEIKSDFKHLEYETVVHKSFENEEEITE